MHKTRVFTRDELALSTVNQIHLQGTNKNYNHGKQGGFEPKNKYM